MLLTILLNNWICAVFFFFFFMEVNSTVSLWLGSLRANISKSLFNNGMILCWHNITFLRIHLHMCSPHTLLVMPVLILTYCVALLINLTYFLLMKTWQLTSKHFWSSNFFIVLPKGTSIKIHFIFSLMQLVHCHERIWFAPTYICFWFNKTMTPFSLNYSHGKIQK